MSEIEETSTNPAPTADPSGVVAEPEAGPAAAPASPRPLVRGLVLSLVGALALFVQLASSRQLPRGALVGALSTLVLSLGLLDLFGALRPAAGDRSLRDVLGPEEGEPLWRAPLVTVPLALLIALVGVLSSSSDAVWAVVLLVSIGLVALSAIRRPALWPAVLLSAVYLPRLGAFALWDPWETHYGEVAREILARDDWISLWWAQEGWFWSKPIWIFWSEAWSMSALGVSAIPDAHPAHPEWALRLPIFVMSLGAALAVQGLASRAFGRRAGALAALVVGTMPHFYLLAHQAITDMPLASALTIAVCLLGLALITPEDAPIRQLRIGPYGVSSHSVALFALLVLGLPQVFYLITRNVTFFPHELAFSTHGDVFLEGSAGNYGVPGNDVLTHAIGPTFANPQPALQGLVWLLALGATFGFALRARSARSGYLLGFYVACAIGFLGKGIPGFALPGLVALFYLVASRRWSLLLRGQLRVGVGIGTVVSLGMPWYVAMHVRHGRGFVDRILVHDHLNRLASGVHGDNGAIDYFLAQLGYGTFPWVGLVPLAILAFAWLPKREEGVLDPRRETTILVGLWAMAGFTLFNAMVTKFHHYIFPVVPPAGLLVGVVLDRCFGDAERNRKTIAADLVLALGTLALLAAIAGATGDPRGIVPVGATGIDFVLSHPWPAWAVSSLAALGSLGVAAGAYALRTDAGPTSALDRGLAAAAFGGAVLVAFVGRDTSWVTAARPAGYERFYQLFIYLYSRPFPAQFDYRPIFTAATVVATIAMVLLALRRVRAAGARMLLTVSLALAVFSVDVYLPDLAEHWSTHLLVDRYYEQRRPSEPLLAFQMNWKGENFYTGNRVHVFQDIDTTKLRQFLEAHRGTSCFVVLEHSRVESFRTTLPQGSTIESRSGTRENNKFVLIHVVVAPRRPAT